MNVALGQIIEIILTSYERRIAVCTEIQNASDGTIRCVVFTRRGDPFQEPDCYPVWEWSNVPYAAEVDNLIGTWHPVPSPLALAPLAATKSGS